MKPDPWWSRGPDELLAGLGSSPSGLEPGDARRRLAESGPNTIERDRRAGALNLLLAQYRSPLVLILLFAIAVSAILRDWLDALIVFAIVLGSTLLGFAQEYRASRAVQRLRASIALTATVIRAGEVRRIPASEIVPGDVVRLSAGNLVPADGVLLEANDLLVTEAALTGEPFPAEKRPGVAPADASVAARANALFLGTSVRSGTARMLVVRTGRATEFGTIADRLAASEPETEFARGLRGFGALLARIMLGMVLFVFAVNVALERPGVESLLFALAIAVGMSPELLPAIVSVTLSSGAQAMARRGVIVRRLDAIENLGMIDVLCTDKTGTITEGSVQLTSAADPEGRESSTVLRLALLNASLQTGLDNPLDSAIAAAAQRAGIAVSPASTRVDEIPYDFERKRLSVIVAEPGDAPRHRIVTKGAFAEVLACCSRVASGDGEAPLDDARRARLEAFFAERGREGVRVLGLATALAEQRAAWGREDETDLCFAGFLLFFDPLKEGIGETLESLRRAGVALKIVSGDNRHVVAHVAGSVGLRPDALLTGAQVDELNDVALREAAAAADAFAEVDPQQKVRILSALKQAGHAVAYMGDGINDAPSLAAADVGISVEGAVDVARESADIGLLRRELGALRLGIAEGRRAFANTLKYVNITTSANFGNMISMSVAAAFMPFLPMLAKQVLLNNFLSDFPSLAIAGDRVGEDALQRAQRWRVADVRAFMVVFGLVSTVFDLLTFAALLWVFGAGEEVFRSAWFVVSLLTEIGVVLVLRTHLPCFTSAPSRLLALLTGAVAAIAVALPFAGPVAQAMGFAPVPPGVLAASLGVTAAYLLVTEFVKLRFFRWRERLASQRPVSPTP